MMKVNKLTKSFGRHHVVDRLSFQLETGRCMALLGPNGAGKTTTLRLMSGLLQPDSGTVHLEECPGDIRAHIGYLPQHPQFHGWMTGREFLLYAAGLSGLSKQEAGRQADWTLDRVGLKEFRNKRISRYSGGMKQRLGIAQAIIHQPKVLLLDEPVSALDPIGRREVLDLMEELKKETILLYSTHILNDAEEVSDEILLMHEGKVIESGTIEEVKSRHQMEKLTLKFSMDSESWRDYVSTWPAVERVEIHKQTLHVYVTDSGAVRKKVLDEASRDDWPLVHFEVGRPTLEDLFIKAVKNHAVDHHL
ncbi:ATP-binding cassette domain-containing protein [Halobacillus litoralis]|uniref:ATP-binding cassette domain-containing protein n=1 Tax=Halobacillus litoralis TaxID=45668 RepID=A0A845DUB4_9BACI|nr:ABC transporter ATP-binding protein [Halobacillus litoralis]MYL21253.1 ATP-binding cassette domain-containing protein [Halobacillus litoralis]